MKIEPTNKKGGLIISFDSDNCVYVYDRIMCISKGGRGTDKFDIQLSDFFHKNQNCKLLETWERKVYDIDTYGRKVDFGVKETREIWDLADLHKQYGTNPNDNRESYSIKEFEMNM